MPYSSLLHKICAARFKAILQRAQTHIHILTKYTPTRPLHFTLLLLKVVILDAHPRHHPLQAGELPHYHTVSGQSLATVTFD